jgi:hypothetical protein
MPQDLGQEDVVGLVFGLEEVAAVPVGLNCIYLICTLLI